MLYTKEIVTKNVFALIVYQPINAGLLYRADTKFYEHFLNITCAVLLIACSHSGLFCLYNYMELRTGYTVND